MARGGKVNPTQVAKALKGASFPMDRDALIEHAQNQEGGDDVLDVLQRLPEREYQNMADVEKGVGEAG